MQSQSPLGVDCQSAEQSICLLARMYAALSETNDAILRSKSPEELAIGMRCRGARWEIHPAATILAGHDAANMRVVATSGVGAQQLRDAAVSIDAALPQGQGMVGHAFREQKPSIRVKEQHADCLMTLMSGNAATAAAPTDRAT